MYYEINVSKRSTRGHYVHYFATAERSIGSETELKTMLAQFGELFPEPEYNITAHKYEKIGYGIDINELLK